MPFPAGGLMVRSPTLLGSTLVLVLLIPSIGSAAVKKPSERKAPPAFSLKDGRNVTRTLAAHKGKVVLLDFWATWCAGCKVEIPCYVEFAKKYQAKGLTALGVAMDDEGW